MAFGSSKMCRMELVEFLVPVVSSKNFGVNSFFCFIGCRPPKRLEGKGVKFLSARLRQRGLDDLKELPMVNLNNEFWCFIFRLESEPIARKWDLNNPFDPAIIEFER